MKRSGERRLVWLATILWLACGVVLWNSVFDREVESAEQSYLARHVDHRFGRGPAVTMRGVMRPAIREAAWTATAWAVVPTAAGLIGVLVARRQARNRLVSLTRPGLGAGR